MMHGILNICKEKGFTSHDVVAKLRRITGQSKIGHTGTLDPDAAGVLPVCLGKATKLCGLLTDRDKTYEAVLLLGRSTDTQDITGKVLAERDVSGVSEEQIREAVLSFLGQYMQTPPMFSALKVNGKKLYELAREGKTVERKAREVTIRDLQIRGIERPRVRISVTCSKGTYIRALCHDIGEKIGCGGCMEELVRTRVGRFELKDSLTLGEAERRMSENTLEEVLVPVDEMFAEYAGVSVLREWEKAARNGGTLPGEAVCADGTPADGQKVRLYDPDGQFIALYQWREKEEEYHLLKMFFPEKQICGGRLCAM